MRSRLVFWRKASICGKASDPPDRRAFVRRPTPMVEGDGEHAQGREGRRGGVSIGAPAAVSRVRSRPGPFDRALTTGGGGLTVPRTTKGSGSAAVRAGPIRPGAGLGRSVSAGRPIRRTTFGFGRLDPNKRNSRVAASNRGEGCRQVLTSELRRSRSGSPGIGTGPGSTSCRRSRSRITGPSSYRRTPRAGSRCRSRSLLAVPRSGPGNRSA